MIDHGCRTEEEVEREVRKVAENSEGLVMVETSHVDVDRVRSSWRATEKASRELVMDPKTAYTTYMAKSRVGIKNSLPSRTARYGFTGIKIRVWIPGYQMNGMFGKKGAATRPINP